MSKLPAVGLLVLAEERHPNTIADDPDRHVDEEDPTPVGVGDEQAAEDRAQRRRGQRRDHDDRARPRPLRRRERPEQHRDADGRQHASADALDDAERDQLAHRLRRPHSSDPSVNAMKANMNVFFVPMRSPSHPDAGIHTARLSV